MDEKLTSADPGNEWVGDSRACLQSMEMEMDFN